MVAKSKLTGEAYERQVAGLKPWKPKGSRGFDSKITFGIHSETLAALRSTPDWADKVRAAITKIISERQRQSVPWQGDKNTVIF